MLFSKPRLLLLDNKTDTAAPVVCVCVSVCACGSCKQTRFTVRADLLPTKRAKRSYLICLKSCVWITSVCQLSTKTCRHRFYQWLRHCDSLEVCNQATIWFLQYVVCKLPEGHDKKSETRHHIALWLYEKRVINDAKVTLIGFYVLGNVLTSDLWQQDMLPLWFHMGRIHYKKEGTLWTQTRLLGVVKLKPVLFQSWSSRPWKISPDRWCDRKGFRTTEPLYYLNSVGEMLRKINKSPFQSNFLKQEKERNLSLQKVSFQIQCLCGGSAGSMEFPAFSLNYFCSQLEIRRQLYLEHAANAEQVKFSGEILPDDFFHFVHVRSCCSVWKLFVFACCFIGMRVAHNMCHCGTQMPDSAI